MGHISECSGILSSLCSLPEVLVGHVVSEIRGEVLPYAVKAPYSGALFLGWALFSRTKCKWTRKKAPLRGAMQSTRQRRRSITLAAGPR